MSAEPTIDGLTDGYSVVCRAWARTFRPRDLLSIAEWAAKYRRLSGKSAAEPGPWRNERVPYLRGIMDALDDRHSAPIVVFTKSSQVGGTDIALNWIGRTIHQKPASFLVLSPTDKVGRKWVRLRLDPMIATCPELRALVPLGRKSNNSNTLAEKHFDGGALVIGSANIPDDVASVSVPNLLLDEVDRMPLVLEDEGDPVELALRRSTTFARSKAFMLSTPTTDETSRIWPMWLASTQDRYHVPCVHCGEMQVLRWQQLKWTAGKPSTAAYICEECGGVIEERSKPDILAAGEWRATFPEREAEVKGFHVNGLYTPIGLGDSWPKHAAAWERAQGKPERLQVFFNTRLGIVHKGERQKLEWEQIFSRREPYALRTIPAGVLRLTTGSDVQANRLETQLLGHGRGERITVLDYIVHYGDPTRAEVWAELDAYLAGELLNSFGLKMHVECSLVDSNYLTEDVLAFTRLRKSRNIFAARGSPIASRQPIGRPSLPDVKNRGKVDRRGVERYEVGVSRIKHWLFERLRADEGTPDQPVLPAERHIRFSDALPEEYFRQLTAEIYDPKQGWIARATYHRNEALDTFVLARAAAMHHAVAVDRMRELDWQRLEALYEPAAPLASASAPVLGKDPIATAGGFLPVMAKVARFAEGNL